jgi:hypothetical protein
MCPVQQQDRSDLHILQPGRKIALENELAHAITRAGSQFLSMRDSKSSGKVIIESSSCFLWSFPAALWFDIQLTPLSQCQEFSMRTKLEKLCVDSISEEDKGNLRRIGSKNSFCNSHIDRIRAGSEIGLSIVDGLRCVIMKDGTRLNLEVQGYRGLESA